MRRIGLEKAAPMAPNMEIASTQKKGGGEKKKGKKNDIAGGCCLCCQRKLLDNHFGFDIMFSLRRWEK